MIYDGWSLKIESLIPFAIVTPYPYLWLFYLDRVNAPLIKYHIICRIIIIIFEKRQCFLHFADTIIIIF